MTVNGKKISPKYFMIGSSAQFQTYLTLDPRADVKHGDAGNLFSLSYQLWEVKGSKKY